MVLNDLRRAIASAPLVICHLSFVDCKASAAFRNKAPKGVWRYRSILVEIARELFAVKGALPRKAGVK